MAALGAQRTIRLPSPYQGWRLGGLGGRGGLLHPSARLAAPSSSCSPLCLDGLGFRERTQGEVLTLSLWPPGLQRRALQNEVEPSLVSPEALVASPDTQSLPALDVLGPPLPACPRQATQRGPALPLTCLLPAMLSGAPLPLWGPQECQTESDREQRLVLRRASSCGHQLLVGPGCVLWAWGPRELARPPEGLGGPGKCGAAPTGPQDLVSAWSFPSHARGSDTGDFFLIFSVQ